MEQKYLFLQDLKNSPALLPEFYLIQDRLVQIYLTLSLVTALAFIWANI